MMQQIDLKALNEAMHFASELGFIVGLSFGIVIGWILHSALKYYYRE